MGCGMVTVLFLEFTWPRGQLCDYCPDHDNVVTSSSAPESLSAASQSDKIFLQIPVMFSSLLTNSGHQHKGRFSIIVVRIVNM